jgi:glycosyltransferase involved in cell wall biosynthesis
MKPIRIAIIFDQNFKASGGHQQALNAALLTLKLPKEIANIFFFTTNKESLVALSKHGIEATFLKISFINKVHRYLRKRTQHPFFWKILKRLKRYTQLERYMLDQEIDLIYFLSPSSLAQDIDELNFIITVWDLSLRDNNEFPEIRMNNMIEVINSYYQDVLKRAMAVFVDSEIGKNNVVEYYAIDRSRVHVMPFEGAISVREHSKLGQLNNINIKKKYNLQVPYVFYPAQFWAHKNHIYLLEGLYVLEHRYGLKVGAIFSGYDEGNLAHVKNRLSLLGLEDRVRFANFVSNQEIPELYLQSIALVMPTYFGPTNLPPLEAFALKVPVLYSDIAGLRDQVGEAALLINLKDPTSMAEHIKNLMNDEQLRNRLIQAGLNRLSYFDSIDRIKILKYVIENFQCKRMCWK